MASKQGDLELLNTPVAQQLLASTQPAQLAYIWTDGTPRVVPIWFHWNGRELIVSSPPLAPKIAVLRQNPQVALTINSMDPYNVLLIRGTAAVELVQGVPQEYREAARRYLGDEAGADWSDQLGQLVSQMARITVRPAWVGTLDFETRFPSAIEAAMAGA